MTRRTKDTFKAIELALAEIHDRDGHLTPDAVVETAQDSDSPLHACFEWNDGKAAAEHRREQARQLIRSVPINIILEERAIQVVAYVRDPDMEHDVQGYRSTASLRLDPEKAKKLLDYELSRAEAYMARAEALAEAFSMKGAVVALHSRIQSLRKRMRESA